MIVCFGICQQGTGEIGMVKVVEQENTINRKQSPVGKWRDFIAVVLIIGLAVFLRLFHLTEIPYGIHVDEAGLGVNAYALANFGVDRYLNSYPVYPQNFDGGQSPFYSYLVAFFIKFFRGGNLDLLAVRLPMALLSLVAFLAGLYLMGNLFDRKWQLFGGFLYTAMPYFIMQCRFGLDCNALVSMLTISLFFLFLAFRKDRYLFYFLFGVVWGITYYTYALSYIANTVTLLFLSVYMLYTKRATVKKLLMIWIPAFVVALPLVIMVFINTFDLPDLMIGKISIFKLDNYRGTAIGFNPEILWKNFWLVLRCILLKDDINYSSFDGFYTMYLCSVPFLFIGLAYLTVKIYRSLKNRMFDEKCIFYLVFLAQYAAGMLLGQDAIPQIHRLNGIFFAQFIVVLCGIYAFVQGMIYLTKSRKLGCGAMSVVGLIYLVSFLLFARFYFFQYKDAVYPQMLYADEYKETLEVLRDMGMSDITTYIQSSIVYFQFSTQMDPYDFYNTPGANLACYKNYFFSVSDIEKGNVYILRKEEEQFIQEAVDKGLELIWEDDIWRTYY